jgi:hypothetical protein
MSHRRSCTASITASTKQGRMIEMMVTFIRVVSGGSTEYKVGRGLHILPLVEISVLFYDMQRSTQNQIHQTSKSQWHRLLN